MNNEVVKPIPRYTEWAHFDWLPWSQKQSKHKKPIRKKDSNHDEDSMRTPGVKRGKMCVASD